MSLIRKIANFIVPEEALEAMRKLVTRSRRESDMDYDIDVEFNVGSHDSVCLTVGIGDGQEGSSAVFLDDIPVILSDTIENFPLGLGQDLVDRQLTLETTVTAINAKTNWTSVTWTLECGLEHLQESHAKEAANVGGLVSYNARFTFVE